jgi:hypothetical protein
MREPAICEAGEQGRVSQLEDWLIVYIAIMNDYLFRRMLLNGGLMRTRQQQPGSMHVSKNLGFTHWQAGETPFFRQIFRYGA